MAESLPFFVAWTSGATFSLPAVGREGEGGEEEVGVGRVIEFRTFRLLQAGLDVFWLGFDYLVSEFIMRRIRQDYRRAC